MKRLKKIINYLRKIVWIKFSLDVFTISIIGYLTLQYVSQAHLDLMVPSWIVRVYETILTTFVFSHEAARWIIGHGRERGKHWVWQFDHGEIYVGLWILVLVIVFIVQGVCNYESPKMIIELALWTASAYFASRISKQVHQHLKNKDNKNPVE